MYPVFVNKKVINNSKECIIVKEYDYKIQMSWVRKHAQGLAAIHSQLKFSLGLACTLTYSHMASIQNDNYQPLTAYTAVHR